MNCEAQALDLCNVPDNTISQTVEVIHPCDSLHLMDEDQGDRDTAVLTRLKDVLSKDEELKTVRNSNNGTIGVPTEPINGSTGDLQQSNFEESSKCSAGDCNDDGEMDIGVDLSLDENGVLEFESATQVQTEESASSCDETVISEAIIELHPQEPLDECSEDPPSVAVSAASTPVEVAGNKHGSKRVTFPSDEDIVSGAVEPKDPWRHAQNVTVEEILNAYRQACQKLNCKPIPKVLKQMQDLKDLTQRNECLDLKGEKLDYKSCESLEEVFKRVQFKVVDLEQTNLDEDGASALFDMIEYYESATHLNISSNKHIGTRGWQAASHMMRKTSSLQYLDARNTPLLDHSAPFVARALRISSSLTVLHLENAGISGRPLMLLATALKMNMNLRELYLAENKLNGLQDSAQLGNLLKFNYNIQILDLRNNHILDSGLAYVCEGLKEQRKGLVTLVLWNNQLTHNGMGYLASALPFTQTLETLNLGHNAVGNEGVHKLKDGLIANRSILRLGLASTKLSCEGAVKSFIETQRALLADIQNGCKRNFILAKEKEETEQKMRQSVSMAEIATEDITQEEDEEKEVPAEIIQEETTIDQENRTEVRNKEDRSESNSEEEQKPKLQDDSDSDTEDEEEPESANTSITVTSPIPIPAGNSSKASTPLVGSPAVISGITVTESNISAPSSPGRCFSVSSPGRGHKIFMVTLVESPPEQQQTGALPKIYFKSQKPAETDTKEPSEQLRLTHPLESEFSAIKTTPAPVKPVNTLSSRVTNTQESLSTDLSSDQKVRSLKSNSTANAFESQTEAADERSTNVNEKDQCLEEILNTREELGEKSPCSDQEALQASLEPSEAQKTLDEKQETSLEASGDIDSLRIELQCVENNSQASPESSQVQKLLNKESNQQSCSAAEHLQASSEISDAESPIKEDTITVESLQTNEQMHIQTSPGASESHKSLNEKSIDFEDHLSCDQNDCQALPEPSESQKTDKEERDGVGNQQSREQEHLQVSPEHSDALKDIAIIRDEKLEASGIQDDVLAVHEEAGDYETVNSGVVLPNGLKAEFTFHLLETEGPKPASCIMEHVSMSAELSCGQDLEELLLDASLDTSRDAP
ncbi:hypothetical protein DNTS_003567 [Danionella cerebrum]|uniref:Protein phosphatase 1 regulatory subunit 37 n=1 Tax=Danionella cerebrum TaxID=2873325 RepID=A0A553PZH5_9TELE|nr:hypothetical protein DNTS_003567 [Danionella translucida]